MERFVSSPACLPRVGAEELVGIYSGLGFRKYEVFTSERMKASFDPSKGPNMYLDLAKKHNMEYTSFHLPPVGDAIQASIKEILKMARFGQSLGASIVLFKAEKKEHYAKAAQAVLGEVETLGMTAVIQNMSGSALTSIADVQEVLSEVKDPRLKVLLEVGHLHQSGFYWKDACDAYADRIVLVHLKDLKDGESVVYGTGEVDLIGLFKHLKALQYKGDYVIEFESKQMEGVEPVADALSRSLEFLTQNCPV